MALDTLDFAVIAALALAAALYFGKDYIFGALVATLAGFTAGGDSNDRNLVTTMKKNDKNAVVFFGSQTGTAEDYAQKLARELHLKFGLGVLTADLADYDYDNLQDLDPNALLFFLVATYGEGEPTDNAVEFFNWLENDADHMSNVRYAVFGLGNSTYEFFNEMAIKLNKRFEALGCERIAPYGQGDDGIGTMDEDFLAWKEECFDALKLNLNLEEREAVYEPLYELIEELALASDDHVSNGEPNKAHVLGEVDLTKGPFNHLHPYLAPVIYTKELFNLATRLCVHVTFDLEGLNLKYSTGDHLAVWPSNSNENVLRFLECFGVANKDGVFSLKTLDSTVSVPFPTPITYEAVVRHHLEISGPISRQALVSVAPFAPNEHAKAECLRLGNDKVAFAAEIHGKQLNLADALLLISKGVAWDSVPFVFVIELIPSLQPRYYLISLSSLSEKQKIHITAVVEAEQHGSHIVTGVVTNLLKNIEVAQNKSSAKLMATYDLEGPKKKFSKFKLPVHVRRSTFKLPTNPLTPIILVGPGTGVAPMRGFVRERIALLEKQENVLLGKILLFYGCRNSAEDFLYKDEWPEYAKKLGGNFELETAFSRELLKKVYVQDRIYARGKELNDLLQLGAFVYVCGDALKMARDVQATFVKIVEEHRGLLNEEATSLVRSLKVQNRYQEDVW